MLKQIGSDEARRLLGECRVGRLGCVVDDGPYVVPVSYILHEDCIYIHSLPGRKVYALRANPRACLQVDEITDEFHWQSVIAFGHYEEVTDEQERNWAMRRILARFPRLTPVESVPVHDGQSSVILFRIRVEEITAVVERPLG